MSSSEFHHRRNPPEFKDQGDMGESPFGGGADPYAAGGGDFGSLSGFGTSAPAQSDFGSLSGFGTSPGGGMESPGGFGGGMDPYGMSGAMPGQQQAQPQRKSAEDVAWEGAAKAGKASLDASKAVMTSLKESNAKVWTRAGARTMTYAGGVSVALLIIQIIGWIVGMKQSIVMPLVGTLLGGGVVGALMWSFNYEKGKKLAGEPALPTDDELPSLEDMMDAVEEEPEAQDFGSLSAFMGGGSDDDDEDDDDDWLNSDDDDEEYEDDEEDAELDLDSALAAIPDITPGTQTRAFLVEQYQRIFKSYNEDFGDWETYEGDDQVVQDFERYLHDAAQSRGVKYDNLPSVIEVKENDFIIEVTARREEGPALALDAISTEMAAVYAAAEAVNPDTGLPDESVYAVTRSAGMQFTVRIYKSVSDVYVGIGDAYRTELAFIKNPKNAMPVILGAGETATFIKSDFASEYSMLISGQPRSGKSWEALAIVLQIAMYTSPREVHFHVMDSKGEGSDYYNLNIPHIKSFAGKHDDMIRTLRWIVEVEGPRRKKVLGDAQYTNYNEYLRDNADEVLNMPRLYMLMDELGPTMESATKEQADELRSLMGILVMQYPGFGIYFIGIPHRITDKMIPKSVSEMVSFRMSVAGSVAEVESATGAKPKDFPYLINGRTGEIALKTGKINKGRVTYMRGITIDTEPTERKKIVDFIRSLWSRLDHEYYHGPWIDFLDKRNGAHDNYDCGMKSHGALRIGGGSTAAQGSQSIPSKPEVKSDPVLKSMTGGFVPGGVESNSARTDGSSVADVSEMWGEDDSTGEDAFRNLTEG